MLRPQFAAACEPSQSARIIQLVTKLTEVLASNQVAIDDRHSPRLYSRFLSGLIAKYAHGGSVLAKPGATGTGGTGASGGTAGPAGGSKGPDQGPAPKGPTPNGTTSSAGPSKSSSATDAGVMHDSPHAEPIPLAPEMDEARDRILASPPARMRSPPIVIRPPTIDQSMQDVQRTNGLMLQQNGHAQNASGDQLGSNIMGDYVTVAPSGDTLSSAASTTQGETTVTDATATDMDYDDSHDMLAAMYAIQDPTWWNTSLLPGFNANFADDGSNSSNEMRQWYANQGNTNGIGLSMNNVPNLFAPGLDFTQPMEMNPNGMDQMMAGYGYR